MIQPINLGQAINDNTGDPLRVGGQKINANFTELDTRVTAAQTQADKGVTDAANAKTVADAAQPKVAGKGLSTNDYTTTEKNKLGAIASGATANSSDATLLNRANHTGTQLAATISNFAAATLAVALSGLSLATGTAVVATDSILVAIGKLQSQATAAATAAATALRSVTPAADTIAYFTGETAAATSAFTVKARALLARTDTAGMQTELGLVPVTSSTDVTAGRLVTPGWMGIGTTSYANATDPNAIRATGFYYCTGTAATPEAYGFLRHNAAGPADGFQEFTSVTTLRSYKRLLASNVWQAWDINVTAATSLTDPALLQGGINSRTVVSGVVVNKFISGLIVMNGAYGPTASVAANTTASVSVTLPASSGVDTSFTTPVVSLIPSQANDFTLITCYMSSPTTLTMIVKNGASAQTFTPKGIIIGHWK